MQPEPAIWPTPRSADWTRAACTPPPTAPRDLEAMLAGGPCAHWIDASQDTSLPAGGYTLTIDAAMPVRVRHHAGLRHAAATLIMALRSNTLPVGRVHDHPAIRSRGVMLDISRDRIPTMREFRDIVRTLALLKINHLQLYVEHTLACRGHEKVWAGWSALTLSELERIQGWCDDFGIELAGNQNCFGHLSELLRTPGYDHLAETHGPYDFYGFTRSGPFSLCPTDPHALELATDLLTQQAAVLRSPLFNIGCDETADVGAGRSAQAVATKGKAAVYGSYVASVANAALDIGKRPMFWADIALSEPAVLDALPKDMIAIAWGYEPDSPFDQWCQTLSNAGFETWLSPGTSAWRSFAGRTRERRANLHAAAQAAVSHSCTGLLVTDWGDLGHRQTWPITLLGLAEGAHAAWNPGAPFDAAALGAALWSSPELGNWLAKLGDADAPLRETCGFPDAKGNRNALHNAGAVFTDMHPARPGWGTPGTAQQWSAVRDTLESLASTQPCVSDALTNAECAHAAEVMLAGCERAVSRRESVRQDSLYKAPDLAERFDAIALEHRRIWLARSRRGGLDRSTAWYQTLADEPPRDAP